MKGKQNQSRFLAFLSELKKNPEISPQKKPDGKELGKTTKF